MKKLDITTLGLTFWIVFSTLGIIFSLRVFSMQQQASINVASCLESLHYTEMSTEELIQCINFDFSANVDIFMISIIFLWISSFIGFFVKLRK